ncbi:hypothetical protein [Pseudomonas sp. TWP3-1]|uniref:hypothetical protein n=1 Tax=Pseudomonas sp. TWP3-1 TaxID=2804631 RepID=UPI003CE9710E
MIHKDLRILIADPQHFQRMMIERSFNRLGYYRIAPVQSLIELLTLVDSECTTFDVVLVNADLAAGSLNLAEYLLDNPQVRQWLIYNEPLSDAATPDLQTIERLMSRVEASRKQEVVTWNQALPMQCRA